MIDNFKPWDCRDIYNFLSDNANKIASSEASFVFKEMGLKLKEMYITPAGELIFDIEKQG